MINNVVLCSGSVAGQPHAAPTKSQLPIRADLQNDSGNLSARSTFKSALLEGAPSRRRAQDPPTAVRFARATRSGRNPRSGMCHSTRCSNCTPRRGCLLCMPARSELEKAQSRDSLGGRAQERHTHKGPPVTCTRDGARTRGTLSRHACQKVYQGLDLALNVSNQTSCCRATNL